MRKIVLACLVIGVAIAMADSEVWFGPNPTLHYQIPNPEPGIFPPVPEIFNPDLDTFRYDDNVAWSAWAYNQAGSGWGVKFISPASSITLDGALIHFYSGWPDPGGTRALVKVFADDGPNGTPGTELWHSDTLTITRGQWNYIPINEPIVGSNYYIFYVQADSYPNCPGLSIDMADNAPSGRMWRYIGGGNFAEDATPGDWLIRSVVDWTPPTVNATTIYWGLAMPRETVPDVNLPVRAVIRNLGTDTLPIGTPVRLHITGPNGYTYDDTMLTTAKLARRQTAQIVFSPTWRIPQEEGDYQISVWTEAAGEMYPNDDTIFHNLGVARWIEYANFNRPYWICWPGPERGTKFNPANFGLQYPVDIKRVRTQFYLLLPQQPWPDSTFRFKIYAGDGMTLLYESPDLEAPPGMPGPPFAYTLDSIVSIPSGEFYIMVMPIHTSGHPSTCCDDTTNGRSYYGSPGGWTPWTYGEFFISFSVKPPVGVTEGYNPTLRYAELRFTNPANERMEIKWQIPAVSKVKLNIYDPTGRLVRNLYSSDAARSGRVAVDLKSLAAGVYLVRLESPAGSTSRKLIINR
ncbi:MAG: T9SS type A sorting domain-containing protein [candidate division WOR-3 bacterium]